MRGGSAGVDAGADLEHAISVAVEAMKRTDGVIVDPAPQALVTAVGTGSVDLELRFWSGSRQLETRAVQSNVIRAVLGELRRAGVPLASATVTVTSPGNDDGPSPLRR